MLSDRLRNTVVGLTMLAAIAAFMVAVFKLDNFAAFSHGRPYVVNLTAPNAGGVNTGTSVNFNGVPIGTVSSVILSKDMSHVEMTLAIRQDVQIPANVVASVGKPPTIGAAFVALAFPDEAPATGATVAYLPTDGTAHIAATTIESGLIPKRTTDTLTMAAADISALAKNLSTNSDNLNQLIHDAHTLIGDAETQANFRRILKNVGDASAKLDDALAQISTATKSANETLGKFGAAADQVGAAATQANNTLKTTETQIVRTTEKLSESLASLNTMLANLSKGKGTAGQLLNDPRLYDGMIDLTKSLKQTSDDLNTLIQKWKAEGLPLHLN